MKYNCDSCKYSTDINNSWLIHLKSKKHSSLEDPQIRILDGNASTKTVDKRPIKKSVSKSAPKGKNLPPAIVQKFQEITNQASIKKVDKSPKKPATGHSTNIRNVEIKTKSKTPIECSTESERQSTDDSPFIPLSNKRERSRYAVEDHEIHSLNTSPDSPILHSPIIPPPLSLREIRHARVCIDDYNDEHQCDYCGTFHPTIFSLEKHIEDCVIRTKFPRDSPFLKAVEKNLAYNTKKPDFVNNYVLMKYDREKNIATQEWDDLSEKINYVLNRMVDRVIY